MSSRDKVNRWLDSVDTSYIGTDTSAGTQNTLEPSEKAFSYAEDRGMDPLGPQEPPAGSRRHRSSRERRASKPRYMPLNTLLKELTSTGGEGEIREGGT